MLWKVFVLYLVVQLGRCQYYGGVDRSIQDHLNQPHAFTGYWGNNAGHGINWPPLPKRREDADASVETDREPLGPDYKDPQVPGANVDPDEESIPGVIDVDVNGYPSNPGFDGGFHGFSHPSYPNGFGGGFGAGFPTGGFPGFASVPGTGDSGLPGFGFGLNGFLSFLENYKQRQPWWKGPNICIEREETIEDEDNDKKEETSDEDVESTFLSFINLSTCRQSAQSYECTTKSNNRGVIKTMLVRYKCCYGYRRTKYSEECAKIELKSLLDTIEMVKADEFRTMIGSAGLDKQINENNYTIFVPRDRDLNDFTEKMFEMNQVELNIEPVRRRRDVRHALTIKDLILNHMVEGFVDLADIEDELILNSEYKNSTIRVNVYPTASGENLVTANCIPISKSNNLAENGIVHVIEGVITPGQYSIKDLVAESKNLTILKRILENEDIAKIFDREGSFTFLAPTDAAFEKLDAVTKRKLLNGDSCAINILKYHIIPHTICSSAINGNVTVHNVEFKKFDLERKEDDSLIIEGSVKILKHDIIAKDGVMHLVDTLLLPDSGLHVTQVLKKHNQTKFEELIESANLVEEIDELRNATVFVPTNEAMLAAEEILKQLKEDPERLKEVVRYHVLQEKIQSCDLKNNEMKETTEGRSLRTNLYSTLPLFTNILNRGTVNCARLINIDEKSCGSVIHTIDKLLIPPEKSIYDIISEEEKYSILNKLIINTELVDILNDTTNSVTLLAVTDETLEKDADLLKLLMEDKEKATELLKKHILTEILCCSGVGPKHWSFNSFVENLSHHAEEIRRNHNQQVVVGAVTVTTCDRLATNGVIHEVNRLNMRQKPRFHMPRFDEEFFLQF